MMKAAFLISVTLILILGVSLSHGQRIQVTDEDAQQCVPFNHTYCNKFNYSTAIFPNPRGHTTPKEAASEFNDFNNLLSQNCHSKLGTLLCFLYFPVCNSQTHQSGDLVNVGFFPCKQLCQEVIGSSCANLIRSFLNSESVPPHLKCDYADEQDRPYYKTEGCINGIAPPFHNTGDQDTSDENNNCDKNADQISNADGNSCVCKTGFTGDGGNCEACPSESCEQCSVRENFGSKTFSRNCYCYALRVNVTSSSVKDCNHVYEVNVLEQYDLQTPYNSTHTTAAPSRSQNDNIIITANPSHCDRCPTLSINQEYLIAGSYSRSNGTVTWKLEKRSLVSQRADKYSKLNKWIKDSNAARISSSLCHRECE